VTNRDVNAALRATEAMKLRARKLTFAEIATRCGYANASAARHAILRELQRVVVTNVEELRREESAMLDTLQAAVYPYAIGDEDAQDEDEKASGKKPAPSLYAIDRVLAISKRRSELLGIDATREEAGAMPVERRYIGVNVEGV
jgi:hypothetical protein